MRRHRLLGKARNAHSLEDRNPTIKTSQETNDNLSNILFFFSKFSIVNIEI